MKKVIKLNINYVNFICNLIEKKKEIKSLNKEVLIKKYENDLNLRFNNIKRVNDRCLRKELKEVLSSVLKEKNINIDEYIKYSNDLNSLNSKRSLNYLEVEC